jgi:hypothetical protein
MAYSGEGNLIEAVVLNDPNKTVIPVVCDPQGRLLIDLTGTSITIGTVEITDTNGNPITATAGALNVNLVGATFQDGDLLVTIDRYVYSNHTVLHVTPASLTPVILLPAPPDPNNGRKNYTLYNDSSSSLLVGFQDTLTSTNFSLRISRNGYFEPPLPQYSGDIYGMWEGTATGSCKATEIF